MLTIKDDWVRDTYSEFYQTWTLIWLLFNNSNLDFVFTVASQSYRSNWTGTSQFEGTGNSKALFASHGEDLSYTAAAGTQIGRSVPTPDRANSRSFSLQDAPKGAIVIEQCMKAPRLSIPAAAWVLPPTARCAFIERRWELLELCRSKITNVMTPAVLSYQEIGGQDRVNTVTVKGRRQPRQRIRECARNRIRFLQIYWAQHCKYQPETRCSFLRLR